ncbi:MAG: RsmE family RNA methyltransferase, partial [Flavisolibacter sp.]
MVSAMLQSQQCWLPVLHEPMAFEMLLSKGPYGQKFVAHCLEEEKSSLAGLSLPLPDSSIILIGPEGDFSPAEIKMALESGYRPVTLGNSRLRTETAALVAATLLCIR